MLLYAVTYRRLTLYRNFTSLSFSIFVNQWNTICKRKSLFRKSSYYCCECPYSARPHTPRPYARKIINIITHKYCARACVWWNSRNKHSYVNFTKRTKRELNFNSRVWHFSTACLSNLFLWGVSNDNFWIPQLIFEKLDTRLHTFTPYYFRDWSTPKNKDGRENCEGVKTEKQKSVWDIELKGI